MKNNSPILFISPTCGACVQQKQILNDVLSGQGKSAVLSQINVDRFPENQFGFIKVTPTWAFPQENQKYLLYEGVISDPEFIKKITSNRNSKFGNAKKLLENINNLDYYGKNFPNNNGFQIPTSFYKSVENTWGRGDDTLNAGLGGTRSLEPSKSGDIYNNNNVNNIRMAHPSDQLGTGLYLNRTCNTLKGNGTNLQSPGMIPDASNPQIVNNTTGFGRNRSRFGYNNLYRQMGPAFEIGNQYLINKNTGNQLYSGARQYETPRPNKVSGDTFIAKAPGYNPNLLFGKKKSTKKYIY
jgi:hypothetical protein